MSLKRQLTAVLLGVLMALPAVPAWAQQTVRIVGTVRDETNAIALPGTPVEVVGTTQVVYTDVDGRYILNRAGRARIRSKWRSTAIRKSWSASRQAPSGRRRSTSASS